MRQNLLRGLATIGQATQGARGQGAGHPVDALSGQAAAGAGGPLQRVGPGVFALEGHADGQGDVVARPRCEGPAQDAQAKVYAAQAPVCLTRRARPVALVLAPCAMAPGVFLGEVVDGPPAGRVRVTPAGAMTAEVRPQWPPGRGEWAAQKHREAGKMVQGGGTSQPQRGGAGVTLGGQGPATRQQGQGVPGGGPQKRLEKDQDTASTG
jgi:hypothetical protein